MNIRNTRELKSFAAQRLEQAPTSKRIVLIYAGITLFLTALVTVINYCLGLQIDQTTGLSSLGTRSMLSTLQTLLPIAQAAFLMCLDLGYLSAMLRIARGQYASPQSLRLGFDRFWPLLRCTLLQALLYAVLFIVSIYAAVLIYLMTPLAKPVTELLMPLVSDAAAAGQTAIALDDAVYQQLLSAMTPVIALCGIVFCAVVAPFFYQFRMANYVLIDRPAYGALAALKESRKMMKGNRIKLFRLDLGLWWYYAALLVSTVICYGDLILRALGIELPFSEDVSYFLFYGLCLAAEFVIYYFLRNRVEVTYALAYDAVKPEEPKNNGVVLGNIFQM